MLVYRAVLAEAPAAVISITLRRNGQAYRVAVRYAVGAGEVRVHRGRVTAMGVAPAAPAGLAVAGYQVDGHEVWVSLDVPASGRVPGLAGGPELHDEFALPLTLTSWGVTRLSAVRLTLLASARPQGETVSVRGVLVATLQTPGGTLRLRVPFLRLLPAPDGTTLPPWRVAAAVPGVTMRVEPGGRIVGEARVSLRLTALPGAGTRTPAGPIAQPRPVAAWPPAAGRQSGPVVLPGLRLIRQVLGHVTRLTARWTGPGQVLVQGRLDLDLYWVDHHGVSRWTGHSLPVSSLLELPWGEESSDRLEATALVERLTHRTQGGVATVEALLQVTVTVLRDRTGTLNLEQYRLQQIVGSATASLLIRERLLSAEPPEEAVKRGAGGGEWRLWQSAERTTWKPEAGQQEGRQPDRWVELPGPVRHLLSLSLVRRRHQPVVQALVLLQPGGAHLVTGTVHADLPAPGQAEGGLSERLLAVPMLAGQQWRLYLWTDRGAGGQLVAASDESHDTPDL